MFQPMVRVELPCLHTFSTKAGAQSIADRATMAFTQLKDAVAYAVLPCAIKLLAAASLYWHFVRPAAAGPAPSLAPQEAP